ncbi:secreted RxLR effector protein 161-like [Capsicum annuum]|uniref:secreted RxLR effector protein 161-like n=1 Tax=Capsicum annuum TaxID=4072 RepID=UPI001FB0B455|nr:secreted RxLR effector protein 161-like [Capsicum annuum]
MVNCNVAATPMNINEKLCHDDGSEMANATYFRSLAGGLNYLSHTRPDIAFSVGVVSRFMHNPSKLHLGAVKRILRYIVGTLDHGIWYSKVTSFTLTGFTDSDYAGNIDDRKSTSGFLFNLGSGAISWSSKKQEVVALSTSESEYIALASAACQEVWLRRLVADFN